MLRQDRVAATSLIICVNMIQPKSHGTFLNSCCIIRVSYRGGGALGYPPPRSSFPPPPRISYHNVIMNQIENCTSINAYRLMRLFFCLNMSKISAKLTEFSSGPSIAIRMSLVKLESFNRFRSRVFIIFI